ncbi:MAG: NAD(P)-dependent alcohol dehydrogenase [Acidobacteriaceae bacterium]
MQAIVARQYGSPDVLGLETLDRPVPGPNQVLLRVRAASVNPLDYHMLHGFPLIRHIPGLSRPRSPIRGVDVAGVVEATGPGVTRFYAGDAVFGSCRGAFAEYVCTAESAVVARPQGVPFEHAAAVPVAGITALQGLRDKGRVRPGQNVLIHGASGGVGTFAVQIAKILGAHVTAVTSPANLDFVRALGADFAIDYAQQDFTQQGRRYDVIFDCYASHSLADCRRALTPAGIYVGVGGPTSSLLPFLGRLLALVAPSPFRKQKMVFFIAKMNASDLSLLANWTASGQLTPVLDRGYPLEQVPEALRYLETGHARGKVVILMNSTAQHAGDEPAPQPESATRNL